MPATARMPATATAISMSMSTSGGILGRVPAQTDHFREIPRAIPGLPHQALELQGQDIHMQSDVDRQGENDHSPTSAGVLAARFSEQSDERHIIGFDSASARSTVFGNLGQVGQATLMQTRGVSGRTAAGLSISGTEHDLERHTKQLSRMDYGEEWQLAMSRGSHNPFPSPVSGLQTSPDIEMRNQEAPERPRPAPAAFSTYNIHVESPGQQRDNGTNFGQAARDEFNSPSGGSELAQDVGGFMGSQPGHGAENDNDHGME
ncbi:hypothetical protein GALMADRAFT_242096 [Galerina marginata CBS 339.88]|uniref:Uncharacterized protein n=1 Tax=Galerina marginata (strain CBS 339.88) TaxID=685588 RepID=A0A067T9V5_GALM3|nr:hypothetical protein GALMADRAFT_242096 [Galerina marginata CBS 339.88]